MNDPEIRELLYPTLDARSAKVDELEIGYQIGSMTRADVVAISDLFLHGYEIKGDGDTLKRIPLQLECYSKVFALMTFVVAEKHIAKLLPMLPVYAGITIARPGGLQQLRPASYHAEQSKSWMSRLLWGEEFRAFLVGYGYQAPKRLRIFELEDMLEAADEISITALEAYICRCLSKRLANKLARRANLKKRRLELA